MDNPYASPASASQPVVAPPGVGMSPRVIQALAGTKPWVRFCSVIGFILTGFMFLGALGMLVVGGMAELGGAAAFGVAAFYVILGVLYLYASIKLWSYGSHIRRLMMSQSIWDLEAALEAQRSFWKFVGIMILIALVLYAGFFALAVVGGFAGAM